MGLTSWAKRTWRKTKRWTARNAGKAARVASTTGAGIAGTALCGPACGIAAAAGTDAVFGGPVERTTSRAVSGGVDTVQDWLDDPQGVPPASIITDVSGATPTHTSVRGDAERKDSGFLLALIVAGAAVVATTYALTRE